MATDFSIADYAQRLPQAIRARGGRGIVPTQAPAQQLAAPDPAQFDRLAAVGQLVDDPAIASATGLMQKATQAHAERELARRATAENTQARLAQSAEALAARVQGREAQQAMTTMLTQANLAATERHRAQMADLARQRLEEQRDAREQRVADKATADAANKLDKQDADQLRRVDRLREKVSASGLPLLLATTHKMAAALGELGEGEDLEGLDALTNVAMSDPTGTLPNFVSDKAKTNAALYQNVQNFLMRVNVGLNQTAAEAMRQARAAMHQVGTNAHDRTLILRDVILPNIEAMRVAILSGKPEDVEIFRANLRAEGSDAEWTRAIPLVGQAPTKSSADAPASKYPAHWTPEMITEFKRRQGQ